MIYGDPIRITPPAALPVSIEELKAHARVDLADEDALLSGYLRAAVEMVEQYTSLSLITSSWTQTFSVWPTTKQPDLILWRRPVQSVTSIRYTSPDNVGSPAGDLLDLSVYQIIGIGQDKVPAKIRLAYGQAWPTLLDEAEAITVTYVAGFGDSANAVPELIRHAVMMAAATWYGFREDVVMGSTVAELPFASTALLRAWRPLAVA